MKNGEFALQEQVMENNSVIEHKKIKSDDINTIKMS